MDRGNALYFSDLQGLSNISNSVSTNGGKTWSTNCAGAPNTPDDRMWFAGTGSLAKHNLVLYQDFDVVGGSAATGAVGSYHLTPSAATGGTFTASNYNISYVNGALTVNAATLTIKANNDTKTYGQTKSYGANSTALVIRLIAPAGRPASWSARAISAWVAGVCSEALRITVFPYASGIATDRTPRISGAFHGAMPTVTPAGWRRPRAVMPGTSDGITSPTIE